MSSITQLNQVLERSISVIAIGEYGWEMRYKTISGYLKPASSPGKQYILNALEDMTLREMVNVSEDQGWGIYETLEAQRIILDRGENPSKGGIAAIAITCMVIWLGLIFNSTWEYFNH